MKYYGTIYKFENLINGKVYIGQTIRDIEKYIIGHFYSSLDVKNSKVFYKAIRKYGIENFKIQVLCQCYSYEDLNWAEDFYIIEWYNSIDGKYGYNMKSNHYGNNEEARLKTSITVTPQIIERWKNPEYKSKVKESLKEWNSSERRKEVSRKAIQVVLSNPYKKQLKDSKIKEHAQTPEFKQLMSELSLKKWKDESFKEKRNQSLKIAIETEEYKKNLKDGLKKSWENNIERKNKQSQFRKKFYSDKENKIKLGRSISEAKQKLAENEEWRVKDSENKKLAWSKDADRKRKTSHQRKQLNERFDNKLYLLQKKYQVELDYFSLLFKYKDFFIGESFKLIELKTFTGLSEHICNKLLNHLKSLNVIESINKKGLYKFSNKFNTNLINKKIVNLTRRINKCQELRKKFQKNQ